MLLTEQEAKQKWCPQARVVPAIMRDGHMVRSADVPAHNRVQEQGIPDDEQPTTHAAMNCIASACMAWRWQSDGSLNKPTRVHPSVLATHWQGWTVTDPTPDANGYVEISPPASKAERGWCGIAGKPEA